MRTAVGIAGLSLLGVMPAEAFVLPGGATQPIQSLIVRDTESTPLEPLSAELPPLPGGGRGLRWGNRSPGARSARPEGGAPGRPFRSGDAPRRSPEGPVLPACSLAPPALWFGQGGERCCEPPSATACI